jgi:predicted RNA-binding Zn-ribbon protein involved in translation (DUF1610 family)
MTDPQGDDPTPNNAYEKMTPGEPYTTGELAGLLGRPRAAVRRLLDALADDDRVPKNAPPTDRTTPRPIWGWEPPTHVCPDCGDEFGVQYAPPSSGRSGTVRYCPTCGTRLRRRD